MFKTIVQQYVRKRIELTKKIREDIEDLELLIQVNFLKALIFEHVGI